MASGDYSFWLLNEWPGVCYQVDCWGEQLRDTYQDINNVSHIAQLQRYLTVCEIARVYNGRAIPIRATSAEAALAFADKFFDFVYLDANHRYEAIKDDLKWWFPKTKPGGIFAGHDYLDGELASGLYGVKSAVDEFATAHGLTVNVTREEIYKSWWIQL